MLPTIEYAFLSKDVYQQISSFLPLNKTSNINNNISWCTVNNVDSTMFPTNHFFARLYLKFHHGVATDAVVAVRGTIFEDWTNLGIDALTWYSDVLGEGGQDSAPLVFTNLLTSFVIKARNYIRRHFPSISHLKFTGHSLGGALAQLMPLKAGFSGETVIFNSPGVGHIPGVMLDQSSWIHNINSRYDLINKIGLNVGTVNIVEVPNKEAEAKQLFLHADQVDFEKSKLLYQIADALGQNKLPNLILLGAIKNFNTFGLMYRVKSYTNTYNSFKNQLQMAQAAAIHCNATAPTHWYELKKQFALTLCTNQYKASQLMAIITAQHAIVNLVSALQDQANTAVAHTYI